MRLVAALAMLAGCDGVLGLIDIHPPPDASLFDGMADSAPGPCGKFTMLVPVQFGVTVAQGSNFTVDSTETHATLMSANTPHVMLLSAGMWFPDNGRDSLQSNAMSPVIASRNEVFLGTPQLNGFPPIDLVQWTYSTSWNAGQYVDAGTGFDALPTGYTMLADTTEIVVEVERYSGMDNILLLRSGPLWSVGTQNPISQAGNTTGGALTNDGLVLVYAQSPSGMTTGSRLYASQRTDLAAEFPVGTPIDLPGSGEDREPALAGDCSHLYFRRDQTIYVAR